MALLYVIILLNSCHFGNLYFYYVEFIHPVFSYTMLFSQLKVETSILPGNVK